MAAMILQKERSQLGVLALLGLRQASLFICNSNEQKEEFEIHLTHHFIGIWLSRMCLLQLQYLCKQEGLGKEAECTLYPKQQQQQQSSGNPQACDNCSLCSFLITQVPRDTCFVLFSAWSGLVACSPRFCSRLSFPQFCSFLARLAYFPPIKF